MGTIELRKEITKNEALILEGLNYQMWLNYKKGQECGDAMAEIMQSEVGEDSYDCTWMFQDEVFDDDYTTAKSILKNQGIKIVGDKVEKKKSNRNK